MRFQFGNNAVLGAASWSPFKMSVNTDHVIHLKTYAPNMDLYRTSMEPTSTELPNRFKI